MANSPVFLLSISLLLLSALSLSSTHTLLFPLKNSLSLSSLSNTTHRLLRSASARSSSRHRLRRQQISLPLSPGSDYTLSLSLSNQTLSLYMDTGSDLVWLPCAPFECILCDGKYDPRLISNLVLSNITNSSSALRVGCKSRACSAAHSGGSLTPSDLCAIARCPLDEIETSDCTGFYCPQFYYAYGDGSLIARLYTNRLDIPMSTPSLGIKNFTFGCAHSALGEPIGVAGFGRGVLSLPAQLATSSPGLANQFSYCLVSHSFDAERMTHPSPLILGRHSSSEQNQKKHVRQTYDDSDEFVYTQILDNPKHPYFYSVGLDAVSVGRRRIQSPDSLKSVDREGNGGMVVDSGTTFTILPSKFYKSVVAEFSRRVGNGLKRAGRVEKSTGLSPCFYYDDVASVPAVVFHFVGNYSSVALPTDNYFYEFLDGGDDGKRKRKVGCVMMMDGGDEFEDESGPVGTLGNYQQQGFEVVYDLDKSRVGFAKRKCASLWDSLNRG